MKLFSKKFFLACLLAGIMALPGCSREKQSPGGTVAAGQQSKPQQHSGILYVKILPDSPTSSDNLQAVFYKGGAVTWRWEKNGQVLENEKTQRLAKTRFARGDTITVIVTSGGNEGKAVVNIANSLPEVHSVRFTPEYFCRGEDVTAVVDGFDADGDEVRFSCKWIINGEESSQDTMILKGDKIKKGDSLSAIITPLDNFGTGKSFKTQTLSIPNAAPWFISSPPTDFKGTIYTYTPEARDPDGDAITYSLVTFPKGMVIDSKSGKIAWPISDSSAGSNTVEVEAQDSEGAKASQKYLLNIILPPEGNN